MCNSFGICDKNTLGPVNVCDSVGTGVGVVGGLGNVFDCSYEFWVHGASIFNGEGKDLDVVGHGY